MFLTTPARAAALALACLAALPAAAYADEGMWMPAQLPQIAERLREAGYAGDPAAPTSPARRWTRWCAPAAAPAPSSPPTAWS